MELKTRKKEIEKEVFVAYDGTEFIDYEECAKYERSALCYVKSKLDIKKGKIHFMFTSSPDLWIVKGDEKYIRMLYELTKYKNSTYSAENISQDNPAVFIIDNFGRTLETTTLNSIKDSIECAFAEMVGTKSEPEKKEPEQIPEIDIER